MKERGQLRPMSHATDNLYETFARDDGSILKDRQGVNSSHASVLYICMDGTNKCMHATSEKRREEVEKKRSAKKWIRLIVAVLS
jgi:hypothetical protein